ncbi:MAG: aspartate/glutamate racemase family protein [Pseudomonadota bacterium]
MSVVDMRKTNNIKLGVIILDTEFPRPVGDIGNPETFPFAVDYLRVQGASPRSIVVEDGAQDWTLPFVAAARELEAQGVDLISTSCGFLAACQGALAEAVSVPVITSSLLEVAALNATLGTGRRTAILTIHPPGLTPDLLAAVAVPPDTPIFGTDPDCHFNRSILGNAPTMDLDQARDDVVAAARRAVEEGGESFGAIVLECTNMAPYADAVRAATGLPVRSINDAIRDAAKAIRAGKPSR